MSILTTNPVAKDYYDFHRITFADFPLIENLRDQLIEDCSMGNFIKVSEQIPKNRLDIGRMMSFIYTQLNRLDMIHAIIIRSLCHYHPDFVDLSEQDIVALENVLTFFKQNDDSTEVLLQGINMVNKERQDLRNTVMLLFYSVMFDGTSFIFSRDLSQYKH